ncbi:MULTISPECIES: DUF4145 domain-containing protein [Microvirga]|uniref:DUF4145 domain-containing protein n=1 Tax=Microvirga TaxID=186650 RepID=UPI0021C731AE|nr:DUF4145 domain-containing protein [Microvirga sp. HBU67655]
MEGSSYISTETFAVRCLNQNCEKFTVYTDFAIIEDGTTLAKAGMRMLPQSLARPQPDYIPKALREDYEEACLIRDLSPKASATLARRCLQGMIRDFCKIAKPRLIDEIKELRTRLESGNAPPGVSAESIDAIDNVREIGNIGAHMEKDIDIIVEVDLGEAQLLIELIEALFSEWYVAQHQRAQRFAAVKAVAAEKKAFVAAAKAPPKLLSISDLATSADPPTSSE